VLRLYAAPVLNTSNPHHISPPKKIKKGNTANKRVKRTRLLLRTKEQTSSEEEKAEGSRQIGWDYYLLRTMMQ
jgi:hypothetical protein